MSYRCVWDQPPHFLFDQASDDDDDDDDDLVGLDDLVSILFRFFKIKFEWCFQESNKRFCAHGHILGVSYWVSISLTEEFSSQGHPHPFVDQKFKEVPKSWKAEILLKLFSISENNQEFVGDAAAEI